MCQCHTHFGGGRFHLFGDNIHHLGQAQTTLDRYGHLMPHMSQEAAKKLDVVIFGSNGANEVQTEQPEIPSIQVS